MGTTGFSLFIMGVDAGHVDFRRTCFGQSRDAGASGDGLARWSVGNRGAPVLRLGEAVGAASRPRSIGVACAGAWYGRQAAVVQTFAAVSPLPQVRERARGGTFALLRFSQHRWFAVMFDQKCRVDKRSASTVGSGLQLVTPLRGATGLFGAPRHGPRRGAERRRMRYTAERCNEWCNRRGGRNNDHSRSAQFD